MKKNNLPYIILVCSPRGNRISMTVPVSGDPIPVVYKKGDYISQTVPHIEGQFDDLYDLLGLIEAIDFPPVPAGFN